MKRISSEHSVAFCEHPIGSILTPRRDCTQSLAFRSAPHAHFSDPPWPFLLSLIYPGRSGEPGNHLLGLWGPGLCPMSPGRHVCSCGRHPHCAGGAGGGKVGAPGIGGGSTSSLWGQAPFPWRNYRLPSACSSDVACVLQSYSTGIACTPPIPVPLALLARHAPLSSGVASATCTSSSSVRPPYVYVFLWCCLHPPPPHSTGVACTTCPVFLWSCIPTIRGQPTAVHLSRRVLP